LIDDLARDPLQPVLADSVPVSLRGSALLWLAWHWLGWLGIGLAGHADLAGQLHTM
jgi:hypothetical protein